MTVHWQDSKRKAAEFAEANANADDDEGLPQVNAGDPIALPAEGQLSG